MSGSTVFVFCDPLLLLSTKFSTVIHGQQVSEGPSFLRLNRIPWSGLAWACPFPGGHLGCPQGLAGVNRAAVGTCGQVFACGRQFSAHSGVSCGVRSLDSGECMFSFVRSHCPAPAGQRRQLERRPWCTTVAGSIPGQGTCKSPPVNAWLRNGTWLSVFLSLPPSPFPSSLSPFLSLPHQS